MSPPTSVDVVTLQHATQEEAHALLVALRAAVTAVCQSHGAGLTAWRGQTDEGVDDCTRVRVELEVIMEPKVP